MVPLHALLAHVKLALANAVLPEILLEVSVPRAQPDLRPDALAAMENLRFAVRELLADFELPVAARIALPPVNPSTLTPLQKSAAIDGIRLQNVVHVICSDLPITLSAVAPGLDLVHVFLPAGAPPSRIWNVDIEILSYAPLASDVCGP